MDFDTTNHACCRFCGQPLRFTFVDLGMSPLCESFLRVEELNKMEAFYPLHVYVCEHCFLVQLKEYVSPEASLRNMHTSPPTLIHGLSTVMIMLIWFVSALVLERKVLLSKLRAMMAIFCNILFERAFLFLASNRQRMWPELRRRRAFPR
jgi:hypothetical protein